MSVKINKNGKRYDLGFMPEHYPADRVYLDGDTDKTVQEAVLRYLDYTIPSRTYTNDSYTQIENTKTSFGIPSNAKVVNITILGNNGGLLCAGINDYENSNYLRFRIHNLAGVDKTQTLPVRIWYQS